MSLSLHMEFLAEQSQIAIHIHPLICLVEPKPTANGIYGATAAACSGDSCNPTGLSNADVASRLSGAAPNTGAVSVEIIYDYHQVLGLPWLTAFVPNPIHVRVFAIMPLVSAEPASP